MPIKYYIFQIYLKHEYKLIISKFYLWAYFLNCRNNNWGNILRSIESIILRFGVARFKEFSLFKVGTTVNYLGFVKIHVMEIFNYMLINLRIGVSSLDCLFVFVVSFFRVPTGFTYVYFVTIFARDLIYNISFEIGGNGIFKVRELSF